MVQSTAFLERMPSINRNEWIERQDANWKVGRKMYVGYCNGVQKLAFLNIKPVKI